MVIKIKATDVAYAALVIASTSTVTILIPMDNVIITLFAFSNLKWFKTTITTPVATRDANNIQ